MQSACSGVPADIPQSAQYRAFSEAISMASDLSGLATSEAAPGPPSFGLDAAGFAQGGEIQSLFEAFCGS
jgi:hypothetical protein